MREIASERYRDLTSPSLLEKRDRLIASKQEIVQLERRERKLGGKLRRLERRLGRVDNWWGNLLQRLGLLDSSDLERRHREVLFSLTETQDALEGLYKETHLEFRETHLAWHRLVGTAFDQLARSQRIWDVTHDRGVTHYKSGAGQALERKPVRLRRDRLHEIAPNIDTFCFENANGPDLHLLPGVIAMKGRGGEIALVRFADAEFDIRTTRFHETEGVPPDAEVLFHTWTYVNKSGGPDRRFRNNPQIPVCAYGTITIESSTGLHEEYMFSNGEAVAAFTEALRKAPYVAAEYDE